MSARGTRSPATSEPDQTMAPLERLESLGDPGSLQLISPGDPDSLQLILPADKRGRLQWGFGTLVHGR